MTKIGTANIQRASAVARLVLKNPGTGKRVARVNAETAREVIEIPELRIVDDELGQRVKLRQKVVRIEMRKDVAGNALNWAHRRKFLLSSLLACGYCGGAYRIIGKDRYGCATQRADGACENGQSTTMAIP